MFNDLKGKRLLIIGGVKMACEYVKRAQEMGIYVVVTDYLKDSPAKKIADKSVLVNAVDVDALVQLCKEECIDGITTGYVDILLPVCYQVCKQLNLPYYGTEEMIGVSTNKILFKEMCRNYDVPVPETYNISAKTYKKDADIITYPVFVKPLDASGSRGASVCRNKGEFIHNFESALSYSQEKQVIVEEYLDGTDFILDYLIIDGKPYLMSMFDRKMCSNRPSAVNHANLLISPSCKLDQYLEEIHPKIVKMFKGMNFKNGLIFLQGYFDDTRTTFFEMGCRLGGTFPDIIEYFTGLNPIDILIHHALTGKMLPDDVFNSINPRFRGKGAVVNYIISVPKGKISKIIGLDKILKMPELIKCIQFMEEGDEFEIGNMTDKPVIILYMVSDKLEKLMTAIDTVYLELKVLDDRGNSLLMPYYGTEALDSSLYLCSR